MRTRTDTQVHIGRRHLESVKEYAGHFVVIMLTRMHQDLLVPLAQFQAYRSSLDELGPRPHDGYKLHGPSGCSSPWCTACAWPSRCGDSFAVTCIGSSGKTADKISRDPWAMRGERNRRAAPLPESAALPYSHGLEHLGDYAALLLRREVGEHRERKHLGGGLLGDREVTAAEAQSLVRLGEMERGRVVDARCDACGGQVLLEPFPLRNRHYIAMVDRPRPRRHVRKDDRLLGVGEEPVVAACPLPAMFVPLRQMTKLHPQDASLDGVEPAVVPLDVVEVFPRLAVIAEHLAAPRQLLVVGGDRSRLSTGAQVFSRIEAECRGAAHRPGLAPAVLLLRKVLRTVRLAGVLDDDEVVLGRQLQDGVHVGHLPVQVHRDDRCHWATSALAHHPAPWQTWCAFGLQVGAQLLRIYVVGALIDVYEIRPRAGLRDGLRGSDKSVRHGHDRIARLHSRGDQGEPQSVCAAGRSNAELRLTELCEVALEPLDHGATDEPGGFERGLENRAQLFPELAVNRDKIEKRNLTRAHGVPHLS